ncbi:radical SAM protein [Peribacillus sp. NPDC097264]|uniref:radical SAM protein n=1 Tax=unclassified Peribacillus TaxID=2675266 RepID=UPI00382541E2
MYIVLHDDVILRNEHGYLESNARFFYTARTRHTEFISAATFELLTYLTTSRTIDDAWNYYHEKAVALNELPDRVEFDEFIKELIDGGTLFLTDQYISSERPLKHLSISPPKTSKYTPMTFPTKVNVTSTMRCNLMCTHCLRESSPFFDTSDNLNTEEMKKLFTDLDNLGIIELAFSGGETTTRKDICELIDHAGTLRCFFEFFTNGHRVTQKVYDSLLRLKDRKGRGLQIHLSLDGDEIYHDKIRGNGQFHKVINTLKRFSNDSFYVIVESVLVPESVENGVVRKVIETCAANGANGISFHPASVSGRAGGNPENFLFTLSQLAYFEEEVLEVAKEFPNIKIEFQAYYYPGKKNTDNLFSLPANVGPQGMFLLAIGADGSVYPCTESIGDRSQIIGNVKETDLISIWNSTKWDFYRGGWEIEELKACQGCIFNGNCRMQTCRCYAKRTLFDAYGAMPECYKVGEEIWEKSKI